MRALTTVGLALFLLVGCGDDDGGGGGDGDGGGPALPDHAAVFSPDDVENDANGIPVTWEPSADDVAAADAALAAHLAVEPRLQQELDDLDAYARQYVGVGAEDARRVSVNALCDTATLDQWRDEYIVVSDGGACFWQATVDPTSGDVTAFTVNGEA